ncbi:MAG: BMP family protein [Bacillota bacterium]
MRKRRTIALLLALALVTGLFASCSGGTTSATDTPSGQPAAQNTPGATQETPADNKKVALLLTGTVNDAGWSESSYRGLVAAQEKFGIETAYTESLQLVDMEPAARDYASLGYDVIVFSSADFNETAVKVSKDYPDIRFVIVNGQQAQEPNLANFRPNTPECGFLAGAFAGLITKSNTVGMIGGKSLPPVVDASKGFEAGAKYVNQNCNVIINYLDSWTDIAKGTEATLSMIEQGADVVCSNTGQAGLGTIDAAKGKGIYAIGYIDDQHEIAPGTVPFSAIQDIGDVVYSAIEFALSDDFKPELKLVGAKDNVIRLSEFYDMNGQAVPDAVVSKMKEIYAGILDGSLKEQGILPKSGFES